MMMVMMMEMTRRMMENGKYRQWQREPAFWFINKMSACS